VVSRSVAKGYSVALTIYDITGGVRIGKVHRRIAAGEALAHVPVLRTDRLVASLLYWDAQTDDARLTLALARTAAVQGAVLANHAAVGELIERDGRVRGALLADGTEVRAATVVNAGGVWSEQIAGPAGSVAIRPAKGVHIVVPADRLPCDYASVLAVPGEKRSVFVVPWAADEAPGPVGPGRYTYVGTTDTDYDGPLDDPPCTAADVEYLLAAVNAWTSAGLSPSDVTGSWAGLRPLISGAPSARTADLSRRHTVIRAANGLITVTGGKLTTYRRMAADTVDAVLQQLGERRSRRLSPTRRLRLLGAPTAGDAATPRGHLHGRYGTEAADVLELCRVAPDLAEPLVPELPYIGAEAVFAARHETAGTVGDVLARRTRALSLHREAAAAAAPIVGRLIAAELGWDEAETAQQVARFEAEAAAAVVAT
jgi:glycerol-3-phosphate dehydrogenase